MPDFPGAVPDIPDANIAETLYTMHGSLGHVQGTNRILANLRALATKLGINNGTGPGGSGAVLRRTATGESGWGPLVNADVDVNAAIAKSKLNLAGGVGIADIDATTFAALLSMNVIRNGDFMFSAFGDGPVTDTNGAVLMLSDSWQIQNNNAGGSQTQRVTGPIFAQGGPSLPYAQRTLVTSALGSMPAASYHRLYQAIEGHSWNQLRNSPFVASFFVNCSVAGTFPVAVSVSGTQAACVMEYTIAPGEVNTWVRKWVAFPTPTAGAPGLGTARAGYLAFQNSTSGDGRQAPGIWVNGSFAWGSTNQTNLCATAGATWAITGVRLNAGTQPAPFAVRDGALEELICRRYRQLIYPGINAYGGIGVGFMVGTTQADVDIPLVPRMRTTPAVTFSAQNGFDMLLFTPSGVANSVTSAITTSSHNTTNPEHLGLIATASSTLTGYTGYPMILRSNGAGGWIECRAEP